jgi:hypothetical protein
MSDKCVYCVDPSKHSLLPAEVVLQHPEIGGTWYPMGAPRRPTAMIKAQRSAHPISAIPDFYLVCREEHER